MLRLVLDDDRDGRVWPVAALVAEPVKCRARLTHAGGGQPGRRSGPADRVADCLAYDAALVRLCDRLQLAQDLTVDGETHSARRRVEARLAERLPTLAAALDVFDGTGAGGAALALRNETTLTCP
jgi:hypothetical protein